MNVSEKIAYLKGLVEGLDIKAGSREDKLISAVVDVLDSISEELDGLNENAADRAEELDAVSDDLSVVEKEVFGDDCCDDECCCDDDHCCDDECEDDEYPLFFEVTCPSCDNTITIDEDVLDLGKIQGPNGGEMLEFDLDSIEDEDESDSGDGTAE